MLAAIRGDTAEAALFRRASTLVRERHIDSDSDLGPIFEIPPDSDEERDVHLRLRHMYDAGGWVLMESAIADLPADLRWLFESDAVTIDQLGALHTALGVTSAADLAAAVRDHAIRAVPGLDEKLEASIAGALPHLRNAIPRIPLGRAVGLVDPVLAHLRSATGVEWAVPVGSLRRGEDTVGDIEIVALAENPATIIDDLGRFPDAARVLLRGPRRLYLLIDRVQIGVRFPEAAVSGATLLHLTGSTAHLNLLRARAAERGWRLTADGLGRENGEATVSATEEDMYAALDLPFIPPEIRGGDDEVDAATRMVLPALLTRTDIRGDLHMHSDWSDGRDTIEAMVHTCEALGYEYLAITDHSPHSAASRNLSVDGVKRQAEEIAQVRKRHPGIAILQGCEVDILPDGKLDFPDRVLETFDIVLASLHEAARHSPDQLLNRYIRAMRHPLVSVITHPTNRLVPHRRGYDLDFDRLFEMAVETGTVLEIDGAPSHLDMDGALARRAIAAGVTVVVNSDCHRAEMLDRQMQLGITMARRGWVEARHVLNTRPLDDVHALAARKRGR